MFMQSNFTRRAAFGQGMLEDMSDAAERAGITCAVAISSTADEKLAGIEEGDARGRDFLRDVAWAYRLCESGKLPALATAEDEDGSAIVFRAFLNNNGQPAEIALKAVRGRGDYGEPVLTVMLPEEEFRFTGRLISLRAEFVQLLAPFATGDLPPTNCLRVEPAQQGGVFIVGMGMHAMGVFHDPEAYCEEPFNLRVTKELARQCKGKYGDFGQRRVVLDGDRATVEGNAGRTYYIEPEPVLQGGVFPDWRGILAKAVQAAEAGDGPALSPLYKPESLDLFNFQGVQGNSLRLHPTGAEGPVVVRNAAFPTFVGITMPLHGGEEAHSPRPDWMGEEFAVQAEEEPSEDQGESLGEEEEDSEGGDAQDAEPSEQPGQPEIIQ